MRDSDKNLKQTDGQVTPETSKTSETVDTTESVEVSDTNESSKAVEASDTLATAESTGADASDVSDNPEAIEDIPVNLDSDSEKNITEEVILEEVPQQAPSSRKKLKTSDIIRYVIMAIAACVFIFAAVNIGKIIYNYKHAQNIYKNIEDEAYSKGDETTSVIDNDGNEHTNISASAQINFDELKAINSRVVGWIEVPTAGISYPVVQGDDNDYYLSHAFNNEFSWSGAIFLNCANLPDLSDPRIIIYGHHMQDGSMFSGLLEYDEEKFFESHKDENYFYIYTEDSVKVYQIFSVCDVTYEEDPLIFQIGESETYMTDLLDNIKSVELYDTGISADISDQIVSLYTCQNGGDDKVRHLVHGKLIVTLDSDGNPVSGTTP